MGTIALSEDKYGEQVAWLTRGIHYMSDQNLQKKLKTAPATIQQQFQERYEIVYAAYRTAENDNSKVYHEVVPKQLPPIPLKSIVNPVPFSYSPLSSDQDPFKILIPSAISRFLSSYNVYSFPSPSLPPPPLPRFLLLSSLALPFPYFPPLPSSSFFLVPFSSSPSSSFLVPLPFSSPLFLPPLSLFLFSFPLFLLPCCNILLYGKMRGLQSPFITGK